jgi:hypothetical protein
VACGAWDNDSGGNRLMKTWLNNPKLHFKVRNQSPIQVTAPTWMVLIIIIIISSSSSSSSSRQHSSPNHGPHSPPHLIIIIISDVQLECESRVFVSLTLPDARLTDGKEYYLTPLQQVRIGRIVD